MRVTAFTRDAIGDGIEEAACGGLRATTFTRGAIGDGLDAAACGGLRSTTFTRDVIGDGVQAAVDAEEAARQAEERTLREEMEAEARAAAEAEAAAAAEAEAAARTEAEMAAWEAVHGKFRGRFAPEGGEIEARINQLEVWANYDVDEDGDIGQAGHHHAHTVVRGASSHVAAAV